MADIEVEIDDSVYLEVYRPLLDSDADIDFLWGGRDSGKSTFLAMFLIVCCLELPYFRCILIKKVYRTIKDAQWQMIKDIVEEWGLKDLFVFNKNPLEIRCINGNTFLARGCDDAGNIKSMANPSHAWYEEGNQLTTEDMVVISTTLRSNRGRVKQLFSFNPESEGNYVDHWLWPYFKEHVPRGVMTFNNAIEVKVPNEEPYQMTYTSTHTTYQNNPYCTSERKASLENLITIDPYYYQVFTKGKWGNKAVLRPFAFAYDPAKHDGLPEYKQEELVYLSFDFNRNPMTCTVFQWYDDWVYALRSIKLPTSNIYEMCDFILELYPSAVFVVTGDASGNNGSAMVEDNLNYYLIIKQKLNLNNHQIVVPTVNPPLKKNRMLVNAVLSNLNFQLHVEDAYDLKWDFQNVETWADGSLKKGDRNDSAQQADILDTCRYFFNTFLRDLVVLENL